MITKEDYKLMKDLIARYESGIPNSQNEPYIISYEVTASLKYNPNFGDDKICECGHAYYRHFDTYDDMDNCGCKYCGCFDFTLAKSETREDKLNKLGL